MEIFTAISQVIPPP